ncbi:probable methyltransferase PMT23 isoform X1 [Mangifera indica]|uniref:probable methyltransferase PMT23 isoform X1 n=1 Tax=Mangifera indica TaxID=29780 RepID=UPI001CF99E2E|nr:probable methyltransferase PMT23 isoform X1 [Mangifera indica]
MATFSVQYLFKERKFPFIFALSLLLITVAVFVFTATTGPASSLISYYFQQLPLIPNATISQTQIPPPFPSGNVVVSTTITRTQTPPPPPPLVSKTITETEEPPPLPSDNPSLSTVFPNVPTSFTDNSTSDGNNTGTVTVGQSDLDLIKWNMCRPEAVDYIPCLDNYQAIKQLQSRKRMEHHERHCPSPSPRCLVPLPSGYKLPVPWPKSRDMIWYNNVPHPKLVDYKKDQNWVRKTDDYFVFPGGGTQFKQGVTHYIDFVQQTFSTIEWGKHVRIALDVGCGVASFGGYLLDKDVITMSFAPKDEHDAQIQFALERGIPATLSVIGTQKLPFPDDAYDLIHCARCRVHWYGDGGLPLIEMNRILRPGGFFVWSATPVYRHDERHRNVWEAMVNLTESMCWKAVARGVDRSRIGLVVFQKPVSYSCYEKRRENYPPLCDKKDELNSSWYAPLSNCLSRLPVDGKGKFFRWPAPWPQRLSSKSPRLLSKLNAEETYIKDSTHWSALVSDVYLRGLAIDWSNVRNVMDMNASYGGFAAALIDQPLWVMNVVPIDAQDTLSTIFDRGLIGIYHDWCESFSVYPRTYDLLHSSFLFRSLTQRCDIISVAAEMDRILRPGGYLLVQDTMDMINKLRPIFLSLHWSVNVSQDQFLVGKKGFWRPTDDEPKT